MASGDRARLSSLLEEIVRDERVLGAATCPSGDRAPRHSKGFPRELHCDRVAGLVDERTGAGVVHLPTGTVHVAVLPVVDDGGAIRGHPAAPSLPGGDAADGTGGGHPARAGRRPALRFLDPGLKRERRPAPGGPAASHAPAGRFASS